MNKTIDNYTDEHKHHYLHQWDMDASDKIYANFDYAQLGIGNGSCGAGVLSNYKLPSSGTYGYRLRFTYVDDVQTGIEDLPSEAPADDAVAAPIYNLYGMPVGNTATPVVLPKGIYISNGKKFVVE